MSRHRREDPSRDYYKEEVERQLCELPSDGESSIKPLRLCVVCGARVTNLNPIVNTCDTTCQMAKESGTDRARMLRIIEQRSNDGVFRVHPSFANRGSRVEDRTVE